MKEIDSNQVRIFDTTLRDGNQAIGINFGHDGKVEVAKELDRMRVDVIEAGFPIANESEFQAVYAVAGEVGNAVVAALCRTVPNDIERGWEAIEPAKDKGGARLHVFMSTSEIHMNQQKTNPDIVISKTLDAVTRAKTFTEDVEFSPMDATRSDFDFMMRVCEVAVENGANTINIPDTTGYMDHIQYAKLIANVCKRIHASHPDVVISAHCHNDRDFATVNTLAAIGAGARQAQVSANGIGERPGNARLATVVSGLFEGVSYIPVEVYSRVDTKEQTRLSQLVAALGGRAIPPNEPLTGPYSFAHGTGIHQDGVIDDPNTYECLRAEDYGQIAGEISIGDQSGKAGVGSRLEALSIKADTNQLRVMTVAIKQRAAIVGRDLMDNEIEVIAAGILGEKIVDEIKLADWSINGGPKGTTARVRIIDKDVEKFGESNGTGGIDALIKATNLAMEFKGDIGDFHADSIRPGSDGSASGKVKVIQNGHNFSIYVESHSVDATGINGYMTAINMIRRNDERKRTQQE